MDYWRRSEIIRRMKVEKDVLNCSVENTNMNGHIRRANDDGYHEL